jgi:hypothetical protein
MSLASADIADDDPITLQEAVDLIYRGNITLAALMAKAKSKELKSWPLGRKTLTTKRYIREMNERCLDGRPVRESTSTNPASNGRSEMDQCSSALAALSQTRRALKRGSKNT